MAATINDSLLGLSPAVTVTGQYLGSGLASQIGFFAAANQYQQQAMVGMAATTADVCRLLCGSSSTTGTPVGLAVGSHSSRVQPESELSSAGACEAAEQAAETALGKAAAAVQDTGF